MENTELMTASFEEFDEASYSGLEQAGTSAQSPLPPPPPPALPASKVRRGTKGNRTGKQDSSKFAAKPGTSKSTDTYDLKGVVNLLILLGMSSANLWEKVIFEMRQKVSDTMNDELTTLYFHLKMISNVICTGIATNSDLSQHKLEKINNIDRDHNELLGYAQPVLTVLSKNLYSVNAVKLIKDIIQEIIKKVSLIEISDDEEEEVKRGGNKRKRSSKTPISGDESDDDDGEGDDDDEHLGELFKLFDKKRGNLSKSKKLLISQQIVTRDEDVLRKCVTPGEIGKYILKVEITDCNDLKGVKPQQYWTKVSKKAVFLVNDAKDPAFTALNNVWMNQAKRILQIKNAKVTEVEETEDSESRKRVRFWR